MVPFSYDEGRQIAEAIIQVIEAKACKHDRISVLLDNASTYLLPVKAEVRKKEQIEAGNIVTVTLTF